MALFRVPVYGNQTKAVHVEPGATKGAKVGTNFYGPDGELVSWSDIVNPKVDASPTSDNSISTTDDLDEGAFNLYFTDERAQDAVGGILQNSDNVTLTYNDAVPSIRADLTDVSVGLGGQLKKYGFDAKGRLFQEGDASTDDLPEGSTNKYYTDARARRVVIIPVVTGEVPPVFVYLDDGSLVYTEPFA